MSAFQTIDIPESRAAFLNLLRVGKVISFANPTTQFTSSDEWVVVQDKLDPECDRAIVTLISLPAFNDMKEGKGWNFNGTIYADVNDRHGIYLNGSASEDALRISVPTVIGSVFDPADDYLGKMAYDCTSALVGQVTDVQLAVVAASKELTLVATGQHPETGRTGIQMSLRAFTFKAVAPQP